MPGVVLPMKLAKLQYWSSLKESFMDIFDQENLAMSSDSRGALHDV